MAKLENNEQQLTALEKYELAKECFEKEDYEGAVSYYEQAAKQDHAQAEVDLAQLNADLLAATGSVECPSCGSKQPQEKAFFADCGSELNKSEEI